MEEGESMGSEVMGKGTGKEKVDVVQSLVGRICLCFQFTVPFSHDGTNRRLNSKKINKGGRMVVSVNALNKACVSV